jgi:ribonuclease G
VIDFIDMDERKNRQKVMQALEEALRSDRAPSKALQFNDFGLVAITRKRVKQSLERTLGEPCPYCTGAGFVKSIATLCNEIYIEMRKMISDHGRTDISLRVSPEVAKALKANNGKLIGEMEELTGKTVLVKSDPLLHQENFDIQ